MHRTKEVPLCDAMQLFPGKTRFQLDACWAQGAELDKTVKSIEQKRAMVPLIAFAISDVSRILHSRSPVTSAPGGYCINQTSPRPTAGSDR